MKTQILEIEAEIQSRPAPFEFQMAYTIRVAIDRIRFAIKQIDPPNGSADLVREATIQLLDALDRLEYLDRCFQCRSRQGSKPFAQVKEKQ